MKKYSKTLIASIGAFFLSTSCCWISTIAIWAGGFTVVGAFVAFVEDLQIVLIGLGAVLLITGLLQYFKITRKNLVSKKD